MTKKYLTEDEVKRLMEHYEQVDDEDLVSEWERGAPVTIELGKPMSLALGALFPAHHGPVTRGGTRIPE